MDMNTLKLDPRIGQLNGGKFYGYPDSRYDLDPVVGTLSEVETALGIPVTQLKTNDPAPRNQNNNERSFTVTLRFESPAWDEVDGIPFPGIEASSKSEAIKYARLLAEKYGHLMTGKGRYWFTAIEDAS